MTVEAVERRDRDKGRVGEGLHVSRMGGSAAQRGGGRCVLQRARQFSRVATAHNSCTRRSDGGAFVDISRGVVRGARGACTPAALACLWRDRKHELRGNVFAQRLHDLRELALLESLGVYDRGGWRVEGEGERWRER